MAIYVKKDKPEILRQALRKLEKGTGIRSTGPGSVARAFAEAITTEIGDLYDALDFNMAQSVLSTAAGRSLDLMGELYNVQRKTINDLIAIDRATGSFYFYLDSPYTQDIVVPMSTSVFTSGSSFVGRQYSYSTTTATSIPAGRTKVFTSIKPTFSDSVFTAAPDTLVIHDFLSPPGALIRCTNPKAIPPQVGYETDDDYRFRITKQVRVASAGTVEAIRFAGLGVNGIRDVKVRTAPYGLGSVEVIITPEINTVAPQISREVVNAIDLVRPAGVRMFFKEPSPIALDVTASIIIQKISTTADNLVAAKASSAINRFLNTLLSGDTVVYNKLIQIILDSSDFIKDVQINRYAPNGVEILRRNYTPQPDEQVVPGRIEVAIA